LVGAANAARLDAVDAPPRLVRRYGTEAPAVVAAADGHPELLRPLAPGVDATAAELRFAVRHEGALDVDDLLDRRTRVGFHPAARAAAVPAAEEMLCG
jgi:glycerol-3-phosphate dehydrogenase